LILVDNAHDKMKRHRTEDASSCKRVCESMHRIKHVGDNDTFTGKQVKEMANNLVQQFEHALRQELQTQHEYFTTLFQDHMCTTFGGNECVYIQ
jgi:hypothetical protein